MKYGESFFLWSIFGRSLKLLFNGHKYLKYNEIIL